jgi:hypothetical protein
VDFEVANGVRVREGSIEIVWVGKAENNTPGMAANGVLANGDERLDPSGYRCSLECRVVQCRIRAKDRTGGTVWVTDAAVVWRCCGCGRGRMGCRLARGGSCGWWWVVQL